jgi:hypothetical protein
MHIESMRVISAERGGARALKGEYNIIIWLYRDKVADSAVFCGGN